MKCFFCGDLFFDLSALLFGPPEIKSDFLLAINQVRKMEICLDCYEFLIEFKPTRKTWRDQYESP
jgi:hypothetical protein